MKNGPVKATPGPLILVANPGSASRKYSLYEGKNLRGQLHFEFEKGKIICTILTENQKHKVPINATNLNVVTRQLIGVLYKIKLLDPTENLAAIGLRIVAPGKFFTGDHLVNATFLGELQKVTHDAPLHITVAIDEIQNLRKIFPDTDIIAISDSSFHANRPDLTRLYAIDQKLAAEHNIERWGYHGISLSSITDLLKTDKKFHKISKVIVAHLGSGCSITSLKNWRSFDTSMGYSPLEGLMSSTRSGSLDPAAALKIKYALKLTDEQLEIYLNKKSGLLGVSGLSDDIRVLQKSKSSQAKLALDMFVFRIAGEIGRQITELGGIDALIFSGTVGERSFFIRQEVIRKLALFNLKLNNQKNLATVAPAKPIKISKSKDPSIYVVPTVENLEIARRVLKFIA